MDITPSASGRELDFPADASPGQPPIARVIREAAFDSIARLQRRMVILSHTSAIERVGAFLLEMADRGHGPPSHMVSLPTALAPAL